MNSSRLNFEPMLGEFGADDPYIFLEKLELQIERSQKKDLPHRILFTFLLPGAFLLMLSIYNLARSHNKTDSFKPLIVQSYLLIGIATAAYLTMWVYLSPIIVSLWNLFHEVNWEEFFNSLARWATVQAAVLVLTEIFFARLAVDSFKLTKTFYSRYQLLKRQAEAEHLKHIIVAETRNRIVEIVPEIMKSLIDQTITAMVASGELNSASAQNITRTMKQVAREIMLNPSNFESLPTTISDVDNAPLELPDDDDHEYGEF
jgi:hypothetical protein